MTYFLYLWTYKVFLLLLLSCLCNDYCFSLLFIHFTDLPLCFVCLVLLLISAYESAHGSLTPTEYFAACEFSRSSWFVDHTKFIKAECRGVFRISWMKRMLLMFCQVYPLFSTHHPTRMSFALPDKFNRTAEKCKAFLRQVKIGELKSDKENMSRHNAYSCCRANTRPQNTPLNLQPSPFKACKMTSHSRPYSNVA